MVAGSMRRECARSSPLGQLACTGQMLGGGQAGIHSGACVPPSEAGGSATWLQGLARAIVTKTNADGSQLPDFLVGKRLLQLDVGLLIAGAKVRCTAQREASRLHAGQVRCREGQAASCCNVGRACAWRGATCFPHLPLWPLLTRPPALQERGELELRVTKLLQECRQEGNIILMIDEARRQGGMPGRLTCRALLPARPPAGLQCSIALRCRLSLLLPCAALKPDSHLRCLTCRRAAPTCAGAHARRRGGGGARRRRRRRPGHQQPYQAGAGAGRPAVHRRHHPG